MSACALYVAHRHRQAGQQAHSSTTATDSRPQPPQCRRTATRHSRQDHSRTGCGSCTHPTGQQDTDTQSYTPAVACWMECRTWTAAPQPQTQRSRQISRQNKKSRPVMVCSFCCAQSLAGASASISMQSSLMASRCRDSGTAQSLYPIAPRYRATLWTMGLSAAMVRVVVTRLTPSARDISDLLNPLLNRARSSTSFVLMGAFLPIQGLYHDNHGAINLRFFFC